MKNEIKIQDERNEKGTGFVEVLEWTGNDWIVLTSHWYYQGEIDSLSIHSNAVPQVNILQFTDGKSKWSKRTVENSKRLGKNYNFTKLTRIVEE